MIDFLTTFDGSGRPPREVQSQALKWLSDDWHTSPVAAIGAPVGSGKSALSRALQLKVGASVITPSNILIDQYISVYPKANYLKGKKHYNCAYSGLTCGDWIDVEEQPACTNCPYSKAKRRAVCKEPTFFNPMSLYHLLNQIERQKCIVVDEAHQLAPGLMNLCGKRFPKSVYSFSDAVTNEVHLSDWLGKVIFKLDRLIDLYHKTNVAKDRIKEACNELEQIGMVKECLDSDPQNYAIWIDHDTYRGKPETFLNVKPVRVPANLVRRLLNCEKLVLLSGTLLKTDIEDLATGRDYRYLDLPSPIPKENRPILYRPMPFPVNKDTDPKRMVEQIEKVLREFPGVNTLIHTTYDRSRKMFPFFKTPVMTNTPETKVATLERFKKEGGVWLAAGCAEGLDLTGDLCRLNIIPHLLRPNLGDPVVKKWKALADGNRRYALETIKGCIQQYGRSNRDPKDHSITVLMDPGTARIVKEHEKDIPRMFTEAVRWSGKL